LMPRAVPRWAAGKASVMIAVEFAISIALPTACATRQPISQSAPWPPVNGSRDRMIEQTVNTAKPSSSAPANGSSTAYRRARTSARTSLIVDPPNGRIPPLTPEAQRAAAADEEFRLALLQSTDTCKNREPACAGGKYDPTPSPRFAESPPGYHTGNLVRINRNDGPEDNALRDRCLTSGLPEFGSFFGSFRRIVQTPGGISMFYDVAHGQGWQRNIVMNGSPHLPANIRQWYGDSRGRWEGNTLVVDVTNFSPKTDFFGSRENLHLVERWTRTGPNTLEYEVMIDDPTVWTRSWNVRQEFTRQSDEENRIYYEPRCVEGNYALPGQLRGRRVEERAFAEGQGPDPRTKDSQDRVLSIRLDPLLQ